MIRFLMTYKDVIYTPFKWRKIIWIMNKILIENSCPVKTLNLDCDLDNFIPGFLILPNILGGLRSRPSNNYWPQTYDGYSALHTQHSMYLIGDS